MNDQLLSYYKYALSENSNNNQMHLEVEKILIKMLNNDEHNIFREWLVENGWIEFMTSEITMGLKNGARGVLIRIAN